jgi:hypothetical protein
MLAVSNALLGNPIRQDVFHMGEELGEEELGEEELGEEELGEEEEELGEEEEELAEEEAPFDAMDILRRAVVNIHGEDALMGRRIIEVFSSEDEDDEMDTSCGGDSDEDSDENSDEDSDEDSNEDSDQDSDECII